MNRVLAVARSDFRRALQGRLLWGAVVLFGLMYLPSTANIAASGHRPLREFLLLTSVELFPFVLPVVAAVAAGAIAGQRAAGTDRFVLSTGTTRREFVLGTTLSRMLVTALAVAVVLGVGCGVTVRGYGPAALAPFVAAAAVVLVYAVGLTAVTVGYSAAAPSQYHTLGGLALTFAAFRPGLGLWSVVARPLFALVATGSLDHPGYETLANAPGWVRLTEHLNPLVGLFELLAWSVALVGNGTPSTGAAPQLFSLLVFVGSCLLAVRFGVSRFERADLSGTRSEEGRFGRALASVAALVDRIRVDLPAASSPRFPATPAADIARADRRRVLRSGVVLAAVLAVGVAVVPEAWYGLGPSQVVTPRERLGGLGGTMMFPLLLLSVAVGHGAIAGERSDGTVRTTLSFGVTRRAFLTGKLRARFRVTLTLVVAVLAFAGPLATLRLGQLYPLVLLALAGWTLGLGLWVTGVAVGVSAAVRSRYRALAALAAGFLVFDPGIGLWGFLVRPVLGLLTTGRFSRPPTLDTPEATPVQFVDALNPLVALNVLREAAFSAVGASRIPATAAPPLSLTVVAALTLVLSVVLTLAAGVRRFENVDL